MYGIDHGFHSLCVSLQSYVSTFCAFVGIKMNWKQSKILDLERLEYDLLRELLRFHRSRSACDKQIQQVSVRHRPKRLVHTQTGELKIANNVILKLL